MKFSAIIVFGTQTLALWFGRQIIKAKLSHLFIGTKQCLLRYPWQLVDNVMKSGRKRSEDATFPLGGSWVFGSVRSEVQAAELSTAGLVCTVESTFLVQLSQRQVRPPGDSDLWEISFLSSSSAPGRAASSAYDWSA